MLATLNLWSVAAALVVSLAAQPLAIRALERRSVLDVPNERSSHSIPTPRGGGIVVVSAVLIGWLFLARDEPLIGIALTVLGAGLLGLLEDLRGTPVGVRLLAQLACATPVLVAASSGTVPILALVPIGALVVVGAVNSVNFMDGVNGITAEFGIAAGLGLALLFGAIGQPVLVAAALVVAAACVGFLPYNAGSARVFLGDSGSYGIGAAIGGLCVLAWTLGAQPEAAIAPLAIYIADTGAVVLRRLRAGEPIHEAHRTHVYQRLTDLGWSHQKVALFVATLTLACGVLGWAGTLNFVPRGITDAVIVGLAALYLMSPRLAAYSAQERTEN